MAKKADWQGIDPVPHLQHRLQSFGAAVRTPQPLPRQHHRHCHLRNLDAAASRQIIRRITDHGLLAAAAAAVILPTPAAAAAAQVGFDIAKELGVLSEQTQAQKEDCVDVGEDEERHPDHCALICSQHPEWGPGEEGRRVQGLWWICCCVRHA